MKFNFKNNTGMSLIEMVIVIAVIGVLAFTLIPFFKVQLQAYLDIRDGKSAMQSARIGFNRMISEIRRIDDPLDIAYGSSTRIDFRYPDDGISGYVTYNYDNTYKLLEREGDKLVEAIQEFKIKYYRADGSQKSTPFYYDSDVWRIEIELACGTASKQVHLSGQVSPRNLHY